MQFPELYPELTGKDLREEELYREKAAAIVEEWKDGKVISKLEALVEDSSPRWLSDFVSSAKKFFQGQEIRDLVDKNKEIVGPKFYKELFLECFLTLQGLFYTRFSITDKIEPRMRLNLNDDGGPQIARIKPTEEEIPLQYFAIKLKTAINTRLSDYYRVNMGRSGVAVIAMVEKMTKTLSSEDYLTFAKAMHFSLPIYSASFDPEGDVFFRLNADEEGFGFYFPKIK